MKTYHLILLFVLNNNLVDSTPRMSRVNPFLDRRKRFLSFPKGTNFVINLTLVKPLLRDSPPINTLVECDVPFPLPSKDDIIREKYNNKISRYIPLHFRQRRQIYLKLEDAFTALGMDGNSCLQRLLCEIDNIQANLPPRGNYLIFDILRVIFNLKDFEKYYGNHFENKCAQEMFVKCKVSFLDLFLKTLGNSRYKV